MEEFGVTREQVSRKVAADPTNAELLSSLAIVDIGLGRKEEAVSEAKRATEMVPISKDAMEGSGLVENLALVYAWADEPNLAFEQLSILIKGPNIFGVPLWCLESRSQLGPTAERSAF